MAIFDIFIFLRPKDFDQSFVNECEEVGEGFNVKFIYYCEV